MINYILVLICLLACWPMAYAQDDEGNDDRVQATKTALITKRLGLTSEQAHTFWPVYDAFEKERRDNSAALTRLRDQFAVASDEEIKAGLRQMTETRRQDAAIEKEYVSKFAKVISARQTAELYRTEFEFQKAIWNRVVKGTGQNEAALETARITFLTNRMKLTTEQSRRLWPVYNEIEKERQANRQAMDQVRNSLAAATSEEAIRNGLRQLADLRQADVDIEQRQTDRFLRIVNARQTAMFYKGQMDFRRQLIRDWRERRRQEKGFGRHSGATRRKPFKERPRD